ncbi:MAG TPA: hypothetical protein VK472_01280 [Allosphingosinicella sp.]|nr:hypothetical protein [Allosphingosinicella sp.]
MSPAGSSVPLEDFIQAVQSQLDNAQARMTLKAQNDRLALTFAIKDISLDLRAHVEMQQGDIRIRPAGANDGDASVFHLVFTAITRPMIDENAVQLSVEDDEDPSIDSLGDALDDDEKQRLERIGVRTVSKLRDMQRQGLERSVGRITSLSPDKLRGALARASRPMVDDVSQDPEGGDGAGALRSRLRVRGRNLLKDGIPARVMIAGEAVSVVHATDSELVLAPAPHQLAGQMSLEHDPRETAQVYFDAVPAARPQPPALTADAVPAEWTPAVAPADWASADPGREPLQ